MFKILNKFNQILLKKLNLHIYKLEN